MNLLKFYCYPKCSTCKAAKKWLDQEGISHQALHIVDECPTVEEIGQLHQLSGLPIQKFFNTSGIKYRELGLKDIVRSAPDEELIQLLATDGMLLKRPLVTDGEKVTIGFNVERFADVWGRK